MSKCNVEMDDELSDKLVKGLVNRLHMHTGRKFGMSAVSVSVMKARKHSILCEIKGAVDPGTLAELKKLRKKYRRERLAERLERSTCRMSFDAGFGISEGMKMDVEKVKIDGGEFTVHADVGVICGGWF